jgi:hypothetical protein
MTNDDTTKVFRRARPGSEETTTTPILSRGDSQDTSDVSGADERTKIFRPSSRSVSSPADSTETGIHDFAIDPVAGWLVISSGPGRGSSHTIGYGMNPIGRGSDSRIRFDYGDQEISRENHAYLTYDGKNKKFYIHHGGGTNLTYVNGAPVLSPIQLMGREEIQIGETRCLFVPFCGEQFNWET